VSLSTSSSPSAWRVSRLPPATASASGIRRGWPVLPAPSATGSRLGRRRPICPIGWTVHIVQREDRERDKLDAIKWRASEIVQRIMGRDDGDDGEEVAA
jgi:hypothetical protein